ncbi:DoxX family membrane protein [Cellulomonas carbonis]|uniref:DoxX family protein n=1 Tax=Cellulomonas carbonis T26 TaxID=947969 RepID=A0A0A0BMQ7_9CELL|nr:DoxX family membrane protein [Cellulomonas carbonis]KGM09763.1 DoxX family protein [Cellulomonas carbonis T26]KGM09768.1 DoxX family protein [Cellulomonas carbonis T26]GGC11712.1 hypothetical protein GCM10010972_26270 [Cellulomonas carbonis]
MLIRRIARPLLATAFVADGVDAVRNPDAHVDRAEEGYRSLAGRLDLPQVDRSQLTTLVRIHGAAVAIAGVALAVGRAPRTAAAALAVLTLPLAVVDQPFTRRGEGVDRFLGDLSRVGAAIIAAVDLEGRPGLAWRAGHARIDRATTKEARAAVAEARREVKAALKEARRVTD